MPTDLATPPSRTRQAERTLMPVEILEVKENARQWAPRRHMATLVAVVVAGILALVFAGALWTNWSAHELLHIRSASNGVSDTSRPPSVSREGHTSGSVSLETQSINRKRLARVALRLIAAAKANADDRTFSVERSLQQNADMVSPSFQAFLADNRVLVNPDATVWRTALWGSVDEAETALIVVVPRSWNRLGSAEITLLYCSSGYEEANFDLAALKTRASWFASAIDFKIAIDRANTRIFTEAPTGN